MDKAWTDAVRVEDEIMKVLAAFPISVIHGPCHFLRKKRLNLAVYLYIRA